MTKYEDKSYDEIDQLIDTDPIELGNRLRTALARIEKIESSARMSNWVQKQMILDMQCAVIAGRQHGIDEGWEWFMNILDGPDLLPDLDATDPKKWRKEHEEFPPS